MTGVEHKSQRNANWLGFWPVVVCWLVLLVLTAVGGAIMNYFMFNSSVPPWRRTIETSVISFMCGLVALGTIVGGLAGRSWVVGWLGVVLLACIHYAVINLVGRDGGVRPERWALCTIWPAFFLSTCAPLVLMRVLFGWTLARRSHPAIPRSRFSLEDLMMVGVVIACSMTISQVMIYVEGTPGIGRLLMLMAVFAGVSLLCIPITVYVSFRIETLGLRVLGWIALALLAFVAIYCSAAILMNKWSIANRNLPYISIGVPVGCLTVLAGILTLRSSGYVLTYFESPTAPSMQASDAAVDVASSSDAQGIPTQAKDTWLEDAYEDSERKIFRLDSKWQARIATAFVVMVAAIGGISVQFDKQRDRSFFQQFFDPKIRGATIETKTLLGLAASADFEDGDLDRFVRQYPNITELSLAGTKVTDAIFPKLKHFRLLEKLDLSRTHITTEGLIRWYDSNDATATGSRITKLSLADTKVDGSALARPHPAFWLKHLDLSGIGLTDDQLAQLVPTWSLSLARNPITDDGVKQLLENQTVFRLDLSDTDIDGATLVNSKCPEDLVLDGTRITDATLKAILATGRVKRLSIARTKITRAILNQLGSVHSLRLGAGLITEIDLVRHTTSSFQHLSLNDPQFNGSCLSNANLVTSSLNLSGSSVTDNTIPQIGRRWLQTLCLAGTQVTDRSLPFLNATSIDLRGTRVTVSGLKQRNNYGTVIVSLDMFTPSELSQLGRSNVQVGGSTFPDSDDLW